MLCFYARMYSTRTITTITLDDLSRLKQEFQERKIDQKFLAEDFSVATLNNTTNKSPLESKSIAEIGSLSPSSSSSTISSRPQPLSSTEKTETTQTEKHKGIPSIIPSNQSATQTKKPLNENISPTGSSLSEGGSISKTTTNPAPPPPPPKSQEKTAIAMYDYTPDGHGIPLTRGEIVIIQDSTDQNWWLVRNSNGTDGWAPASYLQLNNS